MKIIDLSAYLREHSYPGRGILLGRSADNKSAVIAYFIMGRSANSRNRVFTPVEEDNGIMTEAFDPSKMEDPSLIIYHPVRYVEKTGDTVVTNGDQTDTVRDGILAGEDVRPGAESPLLRARSPQLYPQQLRSAPQQRSLCPVHFKERRSGTPAATTAISSATTIRCPARDHSSTPIRRISIRFLPLRASPAVWRLLLLTPGRWQRKSGRT